MSKLSGVYVLSGPGKGKHVWVGQRADVYARLAKGHRSAIRLGCGSGVAKEMPGAHKKDREVEEWDTAQALAADGCAVMSYHPPVRPLPYKAEEILGKGDEFERAVAKAMARMDGPERPLTAKEVTRRADVLVEVEAERPWRLKGMWLHRAVMAEVTRRLYIPSQHGYDE